MEKYKMMLHVLSGAWDTPYTEGSIVLGISEDIEPLQKKLDGIAESKASEYLEHPTDEVEEEIGQYHYEITDSDGRYAKFYITAHPIELSEALMRAVSVAVEKNNRTNDIGQYLDDMYEDGNIEPWKYEYMVRKPDVVETILHNFDKAEDCNTPYNVTMENVVSEVMEGIALNDKVLEFLWEELGDVLIDDDECILDGFIGFECGTHREEVWHWFDENYSGGVVGLMFGGDEDGRD